jgi:osmotically-inducible protein OsmY
MSHARGLRDADVRVAVSQGLIVLSGEVDHLWQKETAGAVAERFRPVLLRNDILVRSSGQQPASA